MLSWGARRQLSIIAIILLALFLVAAGAYFAFFRPTANCFDGIQNADERGADCGGACQKVCSVEVTSLINFWTRIFRVSDGVYDVGALIENPNLGFAIGRLPYTIRVFDAKNVALVERTGTTYVNQKERFLIFESRILTGNRVPTRATLELGSYEWTRLSPESGAKIVSEIGVENKDMITAPRPRLTADVVSNSSRDLRDISVTAVVYDKDQNVLGVSGTHVDELRRSQRVHVVFTWPEAFSSAPVTIEIFPRLNAATP